MLKLFARISKKTILIVSLIVLSSFGLYRYVFDKNDVIIELLFGNLNQFHYSPLKLDDAFSEKAFDLYLRRMDYSKKFLLQSDVDALAKYRKEIDDQLIGQKHDFFNLSVNLISKRIAEKENWSKDILSKPLNYTIDEEYETDWKKTNWCKSEEELKNEWQKMLKYQVLASLDESLNKQETALEKKDTSVVQLSFDTLEAQARKKILKGNSDYFKRLKRITAKERFTDFANAITNVYDPHTEYFPPKEKKRFDQNMSGQFEGIGARLMQKDGVLRVSEIIVGSPSYKQGELKAGDDILKVAQGAAEPVDITDMDMEEAIELIKGKKGTEVRLTVRKSDNSIKVIPIIRDVIEMEDTYAKSVLLENKNKIGYIYLPTFYSDFLRSGSAAHHCSKDMRLEIEKLKKQNITGLIVDLRDNGGGSLQEVVEMAGLFFTRGPVVQVKGKNNVPVNVMEDRVSDVVWDGPLTILINGNSASASEILAAAMQDYKRGVIIGTPSFGKGTVQSFVDMDQMLLPQFDTIKPVGSVKITQQKFYRINGGATQLKGVTPDVVLPDPYEFIDRGEKELDNPMPWDEINKANYTEFSTINYANIIKRSANRVQQNPQFTLIREQANEVKTKRDDTKYNLKLEQFREEQKRFRNQNKKYEDLRVEIKGFKASLLEEDKLRHTNDTSKAGRETRWAKNIAKDIYIYEASNVINDMK
ncbi:MAG: carboxy terminal-processing peptidase [Bacteroidia bacterium]|jgi:carboxyl-terminal processing protease|nr:carboxy terminal-processing peptidase [Bacteroidia bacterium]